MTQQYDPAIYRELEPLANGYVPKVHRRYTFTGESRGEHCNFPVELIAPHPSVPGYYRCQAVFAMNVWYQPDWIRLEDLTPND